MSKKRTSPESSTDEQMNEDSDSAFQPDDSAKRVKLTPFRHTELQDLPMELIECILVKVVAMEVKGMKLAKSVWKEKADLVIISRLRTVCSQWSDILTTNIFRRKLHRILDGTAQETFRLEILHQSPLPSCVTSISTMKDEIFMLCTTQNENCAIHVYDRNNMAEVKDVIPLRGLGPRPHSIAACSLSNCVYILSRKRYYRYDYSIFRIARDDEQPSTVSSVISQMYLPDPTMHVTPNGSLVFSRLPYKQHAPISVCDANGSMQHEISIDISWLSHIIPKSNGNLLLVPGGERRLLEIDTDGIIIRQYQPSPNLYNSVSHADSYGRLLLCDGYNRMELLDSEFNLMDFTGQLLGGGENICPHEFHYNSERNEIVAIVKDVNALRRFLIIFHLKEI